MANFNMSDLSGSDVAKIAGIAGAVVVGIVTGVKLLGGAAAAGWAKFQIRKAEKKAKKEAAKAAAEQKDQAAK